MSARQAEYATYLAEELGKLPKSARLPILDMAMPALKQLPQPQRDALLDCADRLIAADNKLTLAEFVLQTVLARRLDMHAGRAAPVRYPDLSSLAKECGLLLSLAAHVAASVSTAQAPALFSVGVASCAGIAGQELLPVSAIDYAQVRLALERVRQLAPLAKPALVKALLAASGDVRPMPVASADLLRAMCAALETPVPSAVAATYTAFFWHEPSEQIYA